ncbi:hypothetical protein EJ06DRAFT_523332 [Trichodelitschia bisporula]|uniref:Uncharacterized protein n=1 Tax=Trichodelitschia bisporula TaxID=703511 RepID=A0A6G1HRS3_9PEZI|nr:hypothetical protein EJ06DRAFT_523332 [Trichodelitschia bisporula]
MIPISTTPYDASTALRASLCSEPGKLYGKFVLATLRFKNDNLIAQEEDLFVRAMAEFGDGFDNARRMVLDETDVPGQYGAAQSFVAHQLGELRDQALTQAPFRSLMTFYYCGHTYKSPDGFSSAADRGRQAPTAGGAGAKMRGHDQPSAFTPHERVSSQRPSLVTLARCRRGIWKVSLMMHVLGQPDDEEPLGLRQGIEELPAQCRARVMDVWLSDSTVFLLTVPHADAARLQACTGFVPLCNVFERLDGG